MSNGASAVVRSLDRAGVDTVFCLPGEETIALVDALDAAGIEIVVVRHEQHGAFMAAAHGRLTGRPGVLVTTLGPGMTNAMTGLAHATLGGFPMLHIAGQKPRRDNWEGSFQFIDQVAAARSVTKWATGVTDAAAAGVTIDDALRRSTEGRPGAVFVEVPKDVATDAGPDGDDGWPGASSHPPVASDPALDDLRDLVDAARFPVLLIGSGCQGAAASAAIGSLAGRAGLPTVALQMGIGVVPADHPSAMPPLAMHSPDAARLTLEQADLVVTLGYHPDEHPPVAWSHDDLRIAHLAPWPAPIRIGYRPVVDVVGDVADAARRLTGRVEPRDRQHADRVRDAITAQLRSEDLDTDGEAASTIRVVRTLREVLPRDARLALDNGSYKLWFARHFDTFEVNGLLLDNGAATMGAGLATATEAARLEPDRPTIAVIGDGGFAMNVGDLETAVRVGGRNLTVLVLRDDAFGFIADHQRERDVDRNAVDLVNPDLLMLAASYGAHAIGVEQPDDLRAAVTAALSHDGVTVIDCPIDERADDRLHDIDSLAGARARLR